MPLTIGRGINDVAILTLTLAPQPIVGSRWDDNGLYPIAQELQHELVKVENVGLTYTVGGSQNQIRVEPDPEALSLFGITLSQLVDKLENANRSLLVGAFDQMNLVAGQTLQGVPDIGLLLLTARDGCGRTATSAATDMQSRWSRLGGGSKRLGDAGIG